MRNIRATFIILCLVTLTIGCASATENQKILMLVHGATSLDTEISIVKPPLENWGYTVDVFDYTEDYKLIHDNVGGDHWFLNYTTGAHGHGNLDLVTNGTMNYKVIIFGSKSATSYGDIENTSKPVINSMFEAYPFIGFVRMESVYSSKNSTKNLFQVGTNGSVSAKNITTSNPANIWALEPFKGYTKDFSVASEINISTITSNVTVLERFNDSTPAITKVEYPSGAKAFYFAFKDWGAPTHASMFVRLIQQYSGIPYKAPYYSYELDDGGDPIAPNADYLNLVNFTKTNLGGYPTISLMGKCIDNNSPPYIRAFDQSPTRYANNTKYNSNTPDLIASLKQIPDYTIASHGYQHDRDLWEWEVNSTYVDGFATNASGVPNWQNDYIEYPVANKNNLNLTIFSGAEFADPNVTFVESHISRMRTVFNSYGLENYHVVITPKFTHLNYTDAIFSKYGFNVISGHAKNDGYIMATGYNDGVYVPVRVSPSNGGDDADTALDSTDSYKFKLNFWSYIGTKPYALVTSHLKDMQEGNTTGYELRDSRLPSYLILNNAGYKLMSTQAVTNKNIGWLWTSMNSTADSSGNIYLSLNSTDFADGANIHELDIVMPSNINQATLNGKHLINIDNSTLSIGKESGTNVTVEVINGTYNTSLPRISFVSTPATDILKSEYDATTGKISLGFNGIFATDIGINNYNRPFSNGKTTIYSNGNEILSVTPTVGGFIADSIDSLNATIIPSVDAVNITISMWETSGNYRKIWSESSETHDVVTSHVIGDFPSNARIQLNVDGVKQAEFTSNSSGMIEFPYTGYSEHIFEAFLEDEQGQKPIANFSTNVSEGYTPLSVQFNDSSKNATGVRWDFNGDGVSDSEDRNPVYEFTIPRSYTVNLTAINENGTDSKLATINVSEKTEAVLPVANFSANITEGYAPLSVQFNDTSTGVPPTSWEWSFGDGSPNSTEQNPDHIYNSAGTYTVVLNASNTAGYSTKTKYITVLNNSNIGSLNNSNIGSLTLVNTDFSQLSSIPRGMYIEATSSTPPSNITLAYNSTLKCADITYVKPASGSMFFTNLYPTTDSNMTYTLGTEGVSSSSYVNIVASNSLVAVAKRSNGDYRITSYWTADNSSTQSSYITIPAVKVIDNKVTFSVVCYESNRTNMLKYNDVIYTKTPFRSASTRNQNYVYVNQPMVFFSSYFANSDIGPYVVHLYSIKQEIPRKNITPYGTRSISALTITYPGPKSNGNGINLMKSNGQKSTVYVDTNHLDNASVVEYQKGLLDAGWEMGIHYTVNLGTMSNETAIATMDSEYSTIVNTFGRQPTTWCAAEGSGNISQAMYEYQRYGMIWRSSESCVGWPSNVGNLCNSYWRWWNTSISQGVVYPAFTIATDNEPATTGSSINASYFTMFSNGFAANNIRLCGLHEYYFTQSAQNTTQINITDSNNSYMRFTVNTSGYPCTLNVMTNMSNIEISHDGVSVPYISVDDGIVFTATNNTTYELRSVSSPLVANFTSNLISGNVPFTVQFNDTSTGSPTSWEWNFGDGTYSSTQNTTHIFTTAGLYHVTLTVSKNGNSSTITKDISVSEQLVLPVANFSTNVSEGYTPLSVQFNDSSENATEWYWDFGDKSNSTEQNPTHTYFAAGNYTVNLTVTNENGNASKPATITVLEVPVLPSYTNPPTDPDHDGLCEDINGNGILDFNDVVAYYDNMDWIEGNAPVAFFDYNKNGLIDFDDVVILYGML